MRVIPSILFSLIAYFMTGLQRSAGQFFVFLLTIFMASVFGSALCFFIAASIPVFSKIKLTLQSSSSRQTRCFLHLAVALIMVILLFVIMMMFSGFLIELVSIFNWLSWIQWVSAFRYGSNVLTINEFRNITFCLANLTSLCPLTGTDILEKQALDYSTNWDMWKHFFALMMMAVTFLLLALIQLFRMDKSN